MQPASRVVALVWVPAAKLANESECGDLAPCGACLGLSLAALIKAARARSQASRHSRTAFRCPTTCKCDVSAFERSASLPAVWARWRSGAVIGTIHRSNSLLRKYVATNRVTMREKRKALPGEVRLAGDIGREAHDQAVRHR
jgi:hypothetical protein